MLLLQMLHNFVFLLEILFYIYDKELLPYQTLSIGLGTQFTQAIPELGPLQGEFKTKLKPLTKKCHGKSVDI